jgi:hypothetical protein
MEPPVPVDPPDVVDPPAPEPPRSPADSPLPPTGAPPFPPVGPPPAPVERPPLPAGAPPLPRADELPLEPAAPPLELEVAPPARPPVPVAPDEPPRWPPVPLLSEFGEAQLQSSTAIARAGRHSNRLGLGARGLSWPGGGFGKPVTCATRNRERCERDAFMKTPWDVQGSYSLRARRASSQFVIATSFRSTGCENFARREFRAEVS